MWVFLKSHCIKSKKKTGSYTKIDINFFHDPPDAMLSLRLVWLAGLRYVCTEVQDVALTIPNWLFLSLIIVVYWIV